MPLRQDVLDAFNALGLTPDVDVEEATKVYRRLALQHHPDRNHGDPSATHRFQQISHSWDICQRYYENPDWANGSEGRYYPDDDDMDLDGQDLYDFYMFMFAETLYNRFNRSSRKQYRNQRSSRPGVPVFFSFEPTSPEIYRSSYSDDSQDRQDRNIARQQKEKEEYERRKRELELEVEREEREAKERAIKQKANMDRLVGAQERAFKAAHSGHSEEVVGLIKENNLDVNAPRHLKGTQSLRKSDEDSQYESLLHAAACQCDESLFTFLIEKGANPGMLNKQSLNPFHVAIKAGNSNLVRFILERRGGKSFQDYHPSKATLSGITPLQLAIESNDSVTIELLVKHATTHDVERCWNQMDISEYTKDILRTKKGFVPPGEGLEAGQLRGMTKKGRRQHELAREKEARIAEELKRAEINRQKKEERAAKLAAQEEEGLRRKKVEQEEEDGRQHQEEIRRAEAEVRYRELAEVKVRAKAEEEIRLAEAELSARESEQAKLRAEAEEARTRELEEAKLRAEVEIRRTEAEAYARKLEEERMRAEAEANTLKLKEEQEARDRAESEARDRDVAAEWLRVQKERLEMQRIEQDHIRKTGEEKERQRVEQVMRAKEERERMAEIEKPEEETRHRSSEAPLDTVDVPAKTISNRKKHKDAVTDEQRRELRRDKQKERKAKLEEIDAIPQRPELSTSSHQRKASGKKTKPTVDVEQMDERQRNRYEQMMKRRAEQSARDKERHRKMMEERKKAQSPSQSEQSEYIPLTPVSTDARPESVRSMMLEQTLLSLNGTPYLEDIQTCIVPDDLFREAQPLYQPINPEDASFVGKADPVDNTESPPTRKPYRRFFKQQRPRRGAHQS